MTMTDDLVKRWDDYVESMGSVMGDVEHMAQQMRNRIEQLTAQLESTLRDRKLILEERDRTFALMLARAEKAEADNARLRADMRHIVTYLAGPDALDGDTIKFGGTKTYIASLEGGALELRHIARAIRKGDQL